MMSAAKQKLTINSTVRLASGYDMPRIGIGVYQTPVDTCQSVVMEALRAGYRMIDTATAYRNELPVSLAIHEASLSPSNPTISPSLPIPRSSIFLTTKLPPKLRGYDATLTSIQSVLSNNPHFGGYIDLYLIHAPFGGRDNRLGQWDAIEEAHRRGWVRSAGVSNYSVGHLEELTKHIHEKQQQKQQEQQQTEIETAAAAPPSPLPLSAVQYELHPFLARPDIVSFCRSPPHGQPPIAIQAFSPLIRATRFSDPHIQKYLDMVNSHRSSRPITAAQLLLRWSLEMGFCPLPKSVNGERIRENIDVFGFELGEELMGRLVTGRYEPCTWDPSRSCID